MSFSPPVNPLLLVKELQEKDLKGEPSETI